MATLKQVWAVVDWTVDLVFAVLAAALVGFSVVTLLEMAGWVTLPLETGGLLLLAAVHLTPEEHPWHMKTVGYGALVFSGLGYWFFSRWFPLRSRPRRPANDEAEKPAYLPVLAVGGSVLLLLVVIWAQFFAPVGTYRKAITLHVPSALTDQLFFSQAEISLISDDGRTAQVVTWEVSLDDELTLLGLKGPRRNVHYTTLKAVWADGRTESVDVEVYLQ